MSGYSITSVDELTGGGDDGGGGGEGLCTFRNLHKQGDYTVTKLLETIQYLNEIVVCKPSILFSPFKKIGKISIAVWCVISSMSPLGM